MSSFKLWELPQAIEAVGEMLVNPETGELLSEEEATALFEELTEEKDSKLEYLCKLIKNYQAEADALKAQKMEFDKRAKSAERRAESIKKYIKFVLGGEKWKASDASVSVSYRTTKDTVKIDNVDLLPDSVFKCPHTEQNVAKTMVKELIESGVEVAGAHLEDSTSIIIK